MYKKHIFLAECRMVECQNSVLGHSEFLFGKRITVKE